MQPTSFMFLAGEASGDALAAELVRELQTQLAAQGGGFGPRFFGAGGPQMAAVGVELAVDLTTHSVIGLLEALKNYPKFKRLFDQLLDLAFARQPDVIVCVDFSGFNRRFAHAVRQRLARHQNDFHNWRPRIVQYVSPQVWASRADRAVALARDFDLLLCLFPFERDWYAVRTPDFPVEFVGHPMLDRYAAAGLTPAAAAGANDAPEVLLLPGSRVGELHRHLPPMLEAARLIAEVERVSLRMVLPTDALAELARPLAAAVPGLRVQVGGLAEALRAATVALASTGTVTMECAYFGVPTVAFYKTSWSTFQIGRRIIQVDYLAMPNLLAGEAVFPEFIQDEATALNLADAVVELLRLPEQRAAVRRKLATVIASLGGPGATRRAAAAVLRLLGKPE
ncbi:lipid-A-disaccharide synthase [Verrucomicrobiota bacterium]|nr:lipid-A-disaccharide synthase [Verrucomicrobiota bacterium]